MFDLKVVLVEMSERNINRAAFPEWTIPKTQFELVYKAPIRLIYFIFSPFVWDMKKPAHLLGIFDGLFHIMLFVLLIKNFQAIWGNQTLRIILIILMAYLILFGLSTGNFGTGIRHRTKFIIALILMVAPWIPKLVFKKKERNVLE